MGLKIRINNEPETIAKVWNLIRNKVALIQNNSLRLAIKDELEKRIANLRIQNKNLKFRSKNNNVLNLKLPFVGLDLRYKAILLLIIYCPKVLSLIEKGFLTRKFNNIVLNNIKEEILKILFATPNITSNELINKLQNKGFSGYLDNFNFQNIFSRYLINERELNIDKCKLLLDELILMINKTKVSKNKI